MPATESTWRNTTLLHRIFAISGVVLTLATVWMFYKDHSRPWKDIQPQVVNIDLNMNKWRQEQFDTTEAVLAHDRLSHAATAARSQPIPEELLAEFKRKMAEDAEYRQTSVRTEWIDQWADELNRLSAEATKARAAAEEARKASDAKPEDAELYKTAVSAEEAALSAEQAAANYRARFIDRLRVVVREAKTREDKVLGERKFKSANIDAAKANLDIAIRDNLGPDVLAQRQQDVDKLVGGPEDIEAGRRSYYFLNAEYQAFAAYRKSLDKLIATMTAAADKAQKEYEDGLANLERLKTQYKQQNETYFQLSSEYPFIFGKKILTLPILDAFGSPRKVENLWSTDLEQTYGSFGQVRRFDRCTTCHASIQKSLPGQPTTPAFVPEKELVMVVVPPPKDAPPKQRREASGELAPLTLEDYLGVRLAGEGLLRYDDVTVSLVLPKSPGAKAQIVTGETGPATETGLAIRQQVARLASDHADTEFPTLPGLMVGDVITGINGTLLQGGDRGPARVGALLLTLAQDGKPFRITVRRGLPNPFISHPRLDLFVGDNSPHPMQTFACTVCHDGQGSATEFKFASHTPNTQEEAEQWRKEYGWFDNHHWIFPMYPERFAESSCLKCHHEVVELEPSERFPDPPAAKLVHGYQLIRKYGCFGCHEINGFDGPTKRIGPDLRNEPNYFAAAQAVMPYLPARLAHFEGLAAELSAAIAPIEAQLATLAKQQAELEKQKGEIPDDAPDKEARTKALDDQLAALDAEVKPLAEQLVPLRRNLATAQRLAGDVRRTARLVNTLAAHPEDTIVRRELLTMLDDDARIAAENEDKPLAQQQWTTFDAPILAMAGWFKDQEAPGNQRRPGPSLRYLAKKSDRQFLYDWLADPTHFRPTTRMPRFFGLWDHLKDGKGEMTDKVAPTREPIEIRGTIEFLLAQSDAQWPSQDEASSRRGANQPPVDVAALVNIYEPLPRETGISEWTPEEKVARGKVQFQTRGCLACHTHKDFPDVSKYRNPTDIVQGPDLSAVGNKFSADVDPAGPDWLYSWIKEPTRYHTRTVMPNLFLTPEVDAGADPNNSADDKTFDPADDITSYLLADSRSDWKPIPAAASAEKPLDAAGKAALKDLMLEYLNEAFYREQAEQFLLGGIPPEMEGELKGAEKDLIVDPATKPADHAAWEAQREQQQLRYIGRKTIAKYGCFGCHDIPGFEDAKPIGTGLADWGRKDPARLAFEHITHYLEGHGHAGGHAAHGEGNHAEDEHAADEHATDAHPPTADTAAQQTEEFYHHQVEAGNRIGFIYQKLKEPRSYDFEKTENKRYNERLRMPQFPFTAEDREAVITFVLGLVADPPREKYVFTPDERTAALIAGRQALEKYNCAGCHILDVERWSISYPPDTYGPQSPPDKPLPVFPFLLPKVSPKDLASQGTPDHRNLLHSHLIGLPKLSKADGFPDVADVDGVGLIDDEQYSPSEVRLSVDLFQNTIIDGHSYITGQNSIGTTVDRLTDRRPTWGGVLTKYLLPEVTALEKQSNPNASGSEAYGWLPPPLIGQGDKVQPGWLHDFLLEPYPIRPAVFLRMPKFNMSSSEATALASYFAAVDNADYPYELAPQRLDSELAARARAYAQTLAAANVAPPDGVAWDKQPTQTLIDRRFQDALNIVVDGNYCVKCHNVADYRVPGRDRAKAPNLSDVYRRFKPDYVRRWIAQPNMILPYTSMPINVKYDPAAPFQGGVSQDLYHGTSTEQVDALVDLLMNYDQFSRSSRKVAELVKPATVPAEGTPPAGEAPAATGNSGE